MSTESIQAIAVHAHYDTYDCGQPDLVNDLMTGDANVVAERVRRANIQLTVVSNTGGPRGPIHSTSFHKDVTRFYLVEF